MKRVLVLGGAGYIGSHCAKLLAECGLVPIVFDNLSTGHAEAVKWGPLIRGDLLSLEDLDHAFIEARPDAVLHFAALSIVSQSIAEPARYWRNNVTGTLNLLQTMEKHEVKYLVFSSTCAVYGAAERLPIDERTVCSPVSPYGQSKLAAEWMIKSFAVAGGIRSVSLRYFNAAGADPSGLIGEAHEEETHLIPLTLRAALGRDDGLTLFGDDFPTPDGTAIRDYIHVNDLAEAHLAALRYLQAGGSTTSLNVGTGRGTSVLEVIEKAESVTGRKIPFKRAGRRPGDPAELVASPGLAETTLGWQAQHDLSRIMEDAWRWHSNQLFGG